MGPIFQLTNCHVTINQVHYTALLHCIHCITMICTLLYCTVQGKVAASGGKEAGQTRRKSKANRDFLGRKKVIIYLM